MKKPLIIIFFLIKVTVLSVSADQYDDFRLLCPEQQVEKILEVKYIGTEFSRYKAILLENYEPIKPILFRRFELLDPPLAYSGQGKSWGIIDTILREMFEINMLTDDEQIRLTEIYQNQLNFYLKTYKYIDAMSVLLEVTIAYITTGQNIREKPGYGRVIYEKYKLLGFEDLKYKFEEW